MRGIVLLPTYNEKDNIMKILNKLLVYDYLDILVIDDNSPDGTADIVKDLMQIEKRVFLMEREKKLGLGTAYVSGFKWGLEKGYDIFFEIDADLSHDPNEIPNFISKIKEGYDLVVGSRYVHGTISVVGWDFKRLLLSKFANWYATTILGVKYLTDITSGFRAYTKNALEKIDLANIKSNGYAFQIEMVYKLHKLGCKITEIPIIFYERGAGSSKMSRKIAFEAAIMVWRLKFGRN
ncbi:polyprenol monophosphomannose synthase [Calditerrivibrio nitroreducens]|uniref:Dolichyl-phosphate beta-D-mannosyltransferase n=1 Tax=Calditerrivibrio nitroreducens (strain DSM 19672 / NBRC 101217 / Yu37-1) TaxID=768670 RepID=E4TJ30_CALNY|nr:polyprenol monophosphomannose synthase [Calditerrivibrio nitroreducens]ADR18066.1 Dolichyl-phosphate beta-D-mannosyltransferase [Calditerrivibrio nitroreducens DSM 19672]